MKLSRKLLATMLLGFSMMNLSSKASAESFLEALVAKKIDPAMHEKALAAYVNGDFKTAYKLFLQNNGSSVEEIQFFIGDMYYRGSSNFPQNKKKAFEWLMKAAKQENADAQSYVADFYAKGEGGVKQNVSKVVYWNNKACHKAPSSRSCKSIEKAKELCRDGHSFVCKALRENKIPY